MLVAYIREQNMYYFNVEMFCGGGSFFVQSSSENALAGSNNKFPGLHERKFNMLRRWLS